MTDLQIIKQLLDGNHLEPKELIRAKHILISLNNDLKNRKK